MGPSYRERARRGSRALLDEPSTVRAELLRGRTHDHARRCRAGLEMYHRPR